MTPRDPSVDPFSLEAQAERIAAGLKPRRRSEQRLVDRYTKAMDELKRVEDRMARYMRRWDKVRVKVRRYENQLDKLAAEKIEG